MAIMLDHPLYSIFYTVLHTILCDKVLQVIIITSVKIIFKKMYEDVGMAECQKPVKLGGC